jgi:hypothetical protein
LERNYPVAVKGRAETPEDRERLLAELGKLWNIPPDLRLGQLIYNAVGFWLLKNNKPCKARDVSDAIFEAEDDDLLTTIAKYVMENYPPRASTSS